MPSTRKVQAHIWDDESGDPCPMTIEEFDARVEASNYHREQEISEAQTRTQELEELTSRKEALLARLQATLEEIKRESQSINARVAVLSAASRRAQKKSSTARFSAERSSTAS